MDKILIIDFGGQYSQLIARRIRALHVYADVIPYSSAGPAYIKKNDYKGIVLTGGPESVYKADAPLCDEFILSIGLPVLGICYGCQLLAYIAGGKVGPADNGEYGKTRIQFVKNALFEGVPESSWCWMSHFDSVKVLPSGFIGIAYTESCRYAAFCNEEKRLYGVQFHPEVTHTPEGNNILSNFLFRICGLSADWHIGEFVINTIDRYKRELEGKNVLLALSGGVDSSVAALILQKAVGSRLTCVFVDHGLLRKGEGDYVEKTFRDTFGIKLVKINAKDRFLGRLKGITEPEQKRKVIGEEFIRTFEDAARDLKGDFFLAQGTIYPDVIESGQGSSATIKSHHNVGGLPDDIKFEGIVEPLRELFKDEVREAGRKLGLPDRLVDRQPFPGPGLAVRIIGEVTGEKLRLLREADAVFCGEMEKAGKPNSDQYFAVLTDTRSVGVEGDARSYGFTVALRAVSTYDFMTAEWTKVPYDILEAASSRITGEIKEISRVVYDITSKPPATVEWE